MKTTFAPTKTRRRSNYELTFSTNEQRNQGVALQQRRATEATLKANSLMRMFKTL